MIALEKRNERLKGVLPKDYARPALNALMLGELIDLISGIVLGQEKGQTRDVLGRVNDPCCGSGGMFVQSENLPRNMKTALAIWPFMGKNRTIPHGA